MRKHRCSIKIGLVIFGASILFQDILQAGALGIVQALLVVTAVWYVAFWIARRLKVDEEFAVMLSTAVSICGVSAAIAACGAIQGDKKKLSYVTSLVLVCPAPMMILMPWLAKAIHLPDTVADAWMGGVIDTSGAVVAAGTLVSEAAMKASVIVKFSKNVFIGVAAFFLSVWWALRSGSQTGLRPSPRMIWERFPKFILGFMAASLVFSFFVDPTIVSATKPVLKGFQTVCFGMAFVCIGLETRFVELFAMQEGRRSLSSQLKRLTCCGHSSLRSFCSAAFSLPFRHSTECYGLLHHLTNLHNDRLLANAGRLRLDGRIPK